jgi:hypothetical protein
VHVKGVMVSAHGVLTLDLELGDHAGGTSFDVSDDLIAAIFTPFETEPLN